MALTEERAAALARDGERAQRRLIDKKLLTADDDAVSVLLPGRDRMLYWSRREPAPRTLSLHGLDGAPALHGETYRRRPDAGALASLSTAAGATLARSGVRVPIVFDEQARHLGTAWPAASSLNLAPALAGNANAGLVDGRLLVIGVTPNRMIFNAELFEKCAQAYLIARGDIARRTHRIPWWVCLIAGRRLRRDQANAARCHIAGDEAPELTAY